MKRIDPRRVALGLAAPLLAIVVAFVVTSLILLVAGDPVGAVWAQLIDVPLPRQVVAIINAATVYYLSAIAVAIGFRMNLFNIGVDGQYRLAAFAAAAVGTTFTLPKPLHIFVMVVIAVLVGAMWAGIAGLLKTTRGVSEVISTIMLNAIATGLIAYLLRQVKVDVAGSNNIGTKPLPESAHFPAIPLIPGSTLDVFGFIVVAALAGIGYSVLLGRTRFGFDLRATGKSESAAVASGVNVKRMVLTSMLLSGAVAGLVGMPQLLGASYSYSLDFPTGLGFTGIAIALLGRNNAVGMVFAALLFSFLDSSSVILDINNVSKEIVQIMQGTLVLSVVIVYELVRRYGVAAEQRRVSRELEADRPTELEGVTA
jgi:simple sugar transport system permease protein